MEESTSLFLGEYFPSLTEGFRFALPSKIRENIGSKNLIFAKGFEKCLFGYRLSDWKKESDKVLIGSVSDKKSRELKRYLYSGAEEVALDGQGRVVVPQTLANWAEIKAEVVVIGAGDHFEVWDKISWLDYRKTLETNLE